VWGAGGSRRLDRSAAALPSGAATALATGLCGGFLGGALVVLMVGSHGALRLLSFYGSLVGATVLLDLAETSGDWSSQTDRQPLLAALWSWACLLDPFLLASVTGATTSMASDPLPLGGLASAGASVLFYAYRNHPPYRLPR
jgi:uncharacterized membrane protein YeaQ/YmgE (transglycosylase-associated protein family)